MSTANYQLPIWPQEVAKLLAICGTDAFPPAFLKWLYAAISLKEFDIAVAWVMFNQRGLPPRLLFQYQVESERQKALDAYCNTYYLLDPVYNACIDSAKSGFFVLDDLAPDEFHQTEYFKRYYKKDGLADEVNFLFSLSPSSALNISLGTRPDDEKFEPKGVELVRSLEPIVRELTFLHWNGENLQRDMLEPHETGLQSGLQTGYDNFGISRLTAREREVVRLMLKGHSLKSAAALLNISASTVKEHRKNIYEKLHISSHAELFVLFLEALKFTGDAGTDPLENYLASQNLC